MSTALAACGTGSGKSTNGASVPTVKSAGDDQEASAAAAAYVKALGGTVAPPKNKTIGYMWLTKTQQSSVQDYNAVKSVADKFGFKVISCDPEFDAAKYASCATSLAAQNPSVIVAASAPTSEVAAGMEAAHKRGIPWIGIGSYETPSPNLTAQYVPDERRDTKVFDDWFLPLLSKRAGSSHMTLLAFQAPTVGAGVIQRDVQRKIDLKAYPNLSEVTHDLNLSDLSQDTIKAVKLAVGQNPNLVGIWNTCEPCNAPMITALDELKLSAAKTPITGGFYSTIQNRQQIKDGQLTGTVEVNLSAGPYLAMDQALEYWARKTPIAPDIAAAKYPLDFFKPWIITKDNIGDPNTYVTRAPDVVSFFEAKWKAEFGL
jgi:ABC-type sugar transport system substrate-binding protein